MLRAISRFRYSPLRSFSKTLLPFSASSLTISSPFSNSSRRRRRDGPDESQDEAEDGAGGSFSLFGRDPTLPPRLFVVQPRIRPDSLLHSKLAEALNLAMSLEEPRDGFYLEDFKSKESPPHLVVQNPLAKGLKADKYFGPGTVDNIKCHLRALEAEDGVDAVFVNATLSGIQQRNLEAAWKKPVLDRVGLIIEIFNAHAETKEAKLQSELAALMYIKTRLVRVRGPGGRLTFGVGGEAEVVSARGRGSGGRGFISGAGETELQLQHRRIKERRLKLLSQIEQVRRTRALHRYSRKKHGSAYGQGLATVAFVGYTNAGKSTLVSALSESDLYSDDRLFATVDPRLRSVILPSGKKALLSDTVGFISDLPVQLVEAFHATLEEVVQADLLVHVLDSSAPNFQEQRETVLQVLQQIGVSEDKIQHMVEVWNKIDLLQNNGTDNYLDQEECLSEDGEGDGEDAAEKSDMESELSFEESVEEDDALSEFLQDESPQNIDDLESEPSPDTAADDILNLSTQEGTRKIDYLPVGSVMTCETSDLFPPSESNSLSSVKTSAVTGVGLQELLNLIDQKLSMDESCNQKVLGPYDRKWRPSYNPSVEEAAEN